MMSSQILSSQLSQADIPLRVITELTALAQKHGMESVILFGSRAKGTNTPRSDIDIAVSGEDFNGFADDVNEKTHTLLSFDIINLNDEVSEDLKEEIQKDGVAIYEKA